MTFDSFARVAALTLHIIRFSYWIFSEQVARHAKPIVKQMTLRDWGERSVTLLFGLMIAAQLLGINLLPFSNTATIQVLGLLLVALGIGISMSARRTLGVNWAHAAEYQIKKGQTLITNGIYAYIRHPIYVGMSLAYVGAELVAGSWLFLPSILILMIITTRQAQKEEELLGTTYGKAYQTYKTTSHRFIPFLY